MSLQEKFQISVPAKEEAGEPWLDWTDAKKHQAGREVTKEEAAQLYTRLNRIPGVNIDDAVTGAMPFGFAGSTDVTDQINAKALSPSQGFTKHDMKGTDDQYTGEHTDLFYGDAGGFVERNNYMDRE